MSLPIVALIYDFDKTLSPKDMQEYSFLPGINVEPDRFWGLCRDFALDHEMDGVLTYMYLMKKMANGEADLSRDRLRALGRDVAFFPGVRRGSTASTRSAGKTAWRWSTTSSPPA